MDLDDLDELLEDSEPTGNKKKLETKASWGTIAKKNMNSLDDLNDDDDDDLFNWGAKKSTTPIRKTTTADDWGDV